MKTPSTLKINSVVFRVKVMSARDLWAASGDDLLGWSRFKEAELIVCDDMPDDRTAHILLHEALHAIESSAGLGSDEKVIRAMSNGIFSLLRENPELTEYLMKAGNE